MIILASASPRRHELLNQIGVAHCFAEHSASEAVLDGEKPVDYVRRVALDKALSVVNAGTEAEAIEPMPVLGADTAVVCDGRILGKPLHKEDGLEMLQMLSGRTHQVYSAVALCCRHGDDSGEKQGEKPAEVVRIEQAFSLTEVEFRRLSLVECKAYWASGEPEGKAGAYAIQGLAAVFVAAIRGSYSGVVGLPLYETAALLHSFGVPTGMSPGMGAPFNGSAE